ncbi:Apple-like protein [Artemisia annua]|uniref:Apple-like protein n=1 Tax=Artemisia annua TaxID=35608 RepID=A0A2U1KQB6_ARTAN|nr:Apple-like protein [Artemisia annua]
MGTSRSFQAPENWSGRIWGRTGCDFNKSGSWSCATGDCGTGEIECKGRNYTQPVTIAELNMTTGDDYYDVSLLSGFNLPMTIEAKGGDDFCPVTGCATDLNRRCPGELRLEGGGGCQSACQVFPTKDHCCLFEGEEKCNTTLYGMFFLISCPNAISYESVSPSYPARCTADDYRVKFCPRADIFSSIKLGEQLSNNDMLVSMNGNVNLGFFDYIGGRLSIRYWDGYRLYPLWVINPNNVVISSSFDQALSIDPNTGNLIITAGGKIITNITDINVGPNPKVTATLEDNGNLRLINEVDKRVLWQSFDYPNGVLMPGMKVGYDLTTGQNVTMTSLMRNFENPDLGAFTLSWDAPEEASQRLVIHRRGQPYWSSGNLKNQKFEYMPQLKGYKINSTYNNKQRYFSYDKDQDYADQEIILPPWILTPDGRIAIGNVFFTPDFCYGIENRMGCMEGSGLPECRTANDNFIIKIGEFVADVTRSVTDSNLSLGISDCFDKCWNSCSCVGFNSSNGNGTGCVFWYGMNRFSPSPHENSTLIYVIRNKTKNGLKLIWILTGISIPLVILCFGLLWCLKRKKHRREEIHTSFVKSLMLISEEERRERSDENFLELTASEGFEDVHQLGNKGGKGNDLSVFSFASIMDATEEFSSLNKLGQGGFGPVYKVM